MGYIGYQNTGDELMLRAIIRGLSRHEIRVELQALSRDPEATQRLHGVGGPTHDSFSGSLRPSLLTRWRRVRSIIRADVALLGPGGLLQDYDVRGTRNMFSLWRMTALARLSGSKVIGIGLGAGPLETQWGRRYARWIAMLSEVLLLRDPESLELLRELGVPQSKLRLVADLAFAPGLDLPQKERGNSPLLGVSVFNFFEYIHGDVEAGACCRAQVAACLDNVVDSGISIRFVSMQGPFGGNDAEEARKIRELMRNPDHVEILAYRDDPEETYKLISECTWFIGMRLHSLIMALLASVPMAAISYHPKVESFMGSMGRVRSCPSVDDVIAGKLGCVIRCLLAETQLSPELVRQRDEMSRGAEENFLVLREHLVVIQRGMDSEG
jgi:polysaccharide pyruvyl transferase CsaB